MASDFENFWWEDDNITALCSGNCSQDTSVWNDGITDPCYEEYLSAYGKLVPVYSVPERYIDGLNTLCLPSSYVLILRRLGKICAHDT
jgi:hypothetical protein